MKMKAKMFRNLILLGGLFTHQAWAEAPEGWMVAGTAPKDYEFGIDHTIVADGSGSAYIKAKPGAAEDRFGTYTQMVAADVYRGHRVRLSAAIRTDQAKSAQLWLRVDGLPGKPPLAFDNMDSRPIRGTTDWKRYDIVLDVPQESSALYFGFFLSGGKGQAWGDSFRLEPVGLEVPITSSAPIPRMRTAPINLDFDS